MLTFLVMASAFGIAMNAFHVKVDGGLKTYILLYIYFHIIAFGLALFRRIIGTNYNGYIRTNRLALIPTFVLFGAMHGGLLILFGHITHSVSFPSFASAFFVASQRYVLVFGPGLSQ